jgi:hypothetical protein
MTYHRRDTMPRLAVGRRLTDSKRIRLHLSDDIYTRFRVEAAREHRSMASMALVLVRDYVERKEQEQEQERRAKARKPK